MYVSVIREWLAEQRTQMTWRRWLEYQHFKRWSKHSLKLGGWFYGVPYTKAKDMSPKKATKASQQWEVASVYYDVPTYTDYTKNLY